MKSKLFFLLFFALFINAYTQTIEWSWQTSFEGSGSSMPIRMTLDSMGNAIVLGKFEGIISLGDDTIEAQSIPHYFIAKFNNAGSPVCLKDLYYYGLDNAVDVITNASNDIYIAGSNFSNKIITILKLNQQGDSITSLKSSYNGIASNPPARIQRIAFDSENNLWITGNWSDTFSIAGLNFVYPYSYYSDFSFIVKIADDFETGVFAKQMEVGFAGGMTLGNQELMIMNDNSVVVSGIGAMQNLDFGNNVFLNLGQLSSVVYLFNMNSSGESQWAVSAESIQTEIADMWVDDEYIYLVGGYQDTLTIGNTTVNSNFGEDGPQILLVRCLKTGSVDSIVKISRNNPFQYEFGLRISADAQKNIYFTALMSDTLYFGEDTLLLVDNQDYMLGMLDSNLQKKWAIVVGSLQYDFDRVGDIFSDQDGNIYFVGVKIDTVNGKSEKNTSFIAKSDNPFAGINIFNNTKEMILKTYPNPATDLITFELLNSNDQITSITIFDQNGRLMGSNVCNSNRYFIDISKLGTGQYFTTIKTKSGKTSFARFFKY